VIGAKTSIYGLTDIQRLTSFGSDTPHYLVDLLLLLASGGVIIAVRSARTEP
jgi:hypothetical protein